MPGLRSHGSIVGDTEKVRNGSDPEAMVGGAVVV